MSAGKSPASCSSTTRGRLALAIALLLALAGASLWVMPAHGADSKADTRGADGVGVELPRKVIPQPHAARVRIKKDLLGAHKILSCYGVKGIKEELARRHGTSTVCR